MQLWYSTRSVALRLCLGLGGIVLVGVGLAGAVAQQPPQDAPAECCGGTGAEVVNDPPELVGLLLQAGVTLSSQAGWDLQIVRYEHRPDVTPGTILSQRSGESDGTPTIYVDIAVPGGAAGRLTRSGAP